MRNFLIVFILFFVVGCSNRAIERPPATPDVLTESEVITTIYELGLVPKFGMITGDTVYMLPSEKWFREKFPNILWNFQKDMKATFWVAEENDCDNFAKLAAGFAQVLHHNTKEKIPKTSVAIGEFHYYSESLKTMHAINFALVRGEDKKPKILFLEPQRCKIINLTDYEINSCRNCVL